LPAKNPNRLPGTLSCRHFILPALYLAGTLSCLGRNPIKCQALYLALRFWGGGRVGGAWRNGACEGSLRACARGPSSRHCVHVLHAQVEKRSRFARQGSAGSSSITNATCSSRTASPRSNPGAQDLVSGHQGQGPPRSPRPPSSSAPPAKTPCRMRSAAVGLFEENFEVMFVAIVIALGLRAYYLQPFRIPTGSMQPTLNGIVGTPMPREGSEWPASPCGGLKRSCAVAATSKSSTTEDRQARLRRARAGPEWRAGHSQFMHFFSRSAIASKPNFFTGFGSAAAPARAVNPPRFRIGLRNALSMAAMPQRRDPKKGTVLVEGTVDSGDLVLVDKFSYHFRKPKRGEVFVFDTIGIRGIHSRSGDQAPARTTSSGFAACRATRFRSTSPNLLIDGKIAKEPGIQRVSPRRRSAVTATIHPGYIPPSPKERFTACGRYPSTWNSSPARAHAASRKKPVPAMREYAALGDNTEELARFPLLGSRSRSSTSSVPRCSRFGRSPPGHWGFIR
jgi:signal peptidase I